MTWILTLALYSGSFVKEFSTENECVVELRRLAAVIEIAGESEIQEITCTKSNNEGEI